MHPPSLSGVIYALIHQSRKCGGLETTIRVYIKLIGWVISTNLLRYSKREGVGVVLRELVGKLRNSKT